jgi:hypothetical protein
MAARGEFSPSGDSFAQLTSDSRLKVWDSDIGAATQEFAPPGDLAAELTAVAWGRAAAPNSTSKYARVLCSPRRPPHPVTKLRHAYFHFETPVSRWGKGRWMGRAIRVQRGSKQRLQSCL